MKTTIDIAEALVRKARLAASKRGITLAALVEEALRSALDVPSTRGRGRGTSFRVKTFGGEGLQPGVEGGTWETCRGISSEGRGG